MNALKIEGTNLTPVVDFNLLTGRFEISGYSRPEDVREFYKPIIEWLSEYYKLIENGTLDSNYNKSKLLFILKYTYFNSASTKFISDILFQIVKFKGLGMEVDIDWYYEEYDEDMREVGEDLSDMVNYKFNYYSFRKEDDDE